MKNISNVSSIVVDHLSEVREYGLVSLFRLFFNQLKLSFGKIRDRCLHLSEILVELADIEGVSCHIWLERRVDLFLFDLFPVPTIFQPSMVKDLIKVALSSKSST